MFELIEIQHTLSQFLWPFIRISALIMSMSIFGARTIPNPVKLGLAILITVLLMPSIPMAKSIEVLSGTGFVTVVAQLGIGIGMGLASRMLFETFVIGGQMVAMQTGLGFASLVDPANGVQVPILGQFFLMLVTLIFLAVDGQLLLLRIVAESFQSFPISDNGLPQQALWSFVEFARWMFAGAVMMAISAALALLIVNLTFGVMTKAAPQLNIFAIGFPISMVTGLLIIWLTLGSFGTHFDNQFGRTMQLVCSLVDLEC
jgi:flagellar biosynthetic protein FliR